jgi:hypothetical protein
MRPYLKNKQKQGQWSGLSRRASAKQAQSPEFTPRDPQKKQTKNTEEESKAKGLGAQFPDFNPSTAKI